MIVVGIDEVGRGCWAGPIVAGAVVLNGKIPGLKDSKLLSKKQREKLTAIIELNALATGLGWVAPADIDQIGLTAATGLAMKRALEKITIDYDEIIIDGNHNFLRENPKSRTIIRADHSIAAVSAASIIAKVARDNYMAALATKYPAYGFDKHVGYGTAYHLAQLNLHGISALHRKSFKPIQALLELSA